MDCVFCKIVEGSLPSKKVYEDDEVLVFHDIAPQAPVHLLAIPKRHIASAAELTKQDAPLLGHLFDVLARLPVELGITNGYRFVINTGEDAGQTVFHLHINLLAGEKLPHLGNR